MAIKAKTFIHNDDKLIGTDGSADGVLPEDVQDFITANVGTLDATTSLNITCCPYGNNQIFTLVVLDNS